MINTLNIQASSISVKCPGKLKCGDSSCDLMLTRSNCILLIVSDGVSTKPRDYLASATVYESIVDSLSSLREVSTYDIEAAVSTANEILKAGVGGTKGMMATLSLIVYDIQKSICFYTNIGDSRIYGIRNNLIEQISIDDVKRVPFIENGKLKMNKGVPLFATGLTKAMGDQSLSIEVKQLDTTNYNAFILASDGAYNLPKFERMINSCLSEPDLKRGFEDLQKLLPDIIEDDASVAVIRWPSDKIGIITIQILSGLIPDSEYSLLDIKLAVQGIIEKGITDKNVKDINRAIEYMGIQNISFDKEIMIGWLNQLVRIPGCSIQGLSSIIRKSSI